jgi:hypothetical protein
LLPLIRAVAVWAVVLAIVATPRLQPQVTPATAAVTQLISYDRQSVVRETRAHRAEVAQVAQVQAWSEELRQGLAAYQAEQAALAAAQAEAARVAALNNHPPPPPDIAQIITAAFAPLGQAAVTWALRVAWCESRYHPNSVNSSSGASGLFQFMPGTWAGTPWASQSPFDPVANAQAAAWLYNRYGPGRWTCQ